MGVKIIIKKKNIYGEDKYYPACKASEAFAAIAGTRTLTESTLRLVKSLGYDLELEQQTINI